MEHFNEGSAQGISTLNSVALPTEALSPPVFLSAHITAWLPLSTDEKSAVHTINTRGSEWEQRKREKERE